MRGWVGFGVCALAFASGLLLLLSGDGEPIATARALAEAVCLAPEAPAPAASLKRHLAEQVALVVVGGESGSFSLEEVIAELEELRREHPHCTLKLTEPRLAEQAQGLQRVSGGFEYSESEASDLHAERRRFDAWFRASDAGFRLERVRLGAVERAPPEPRP